MDINIFISNLNSWINPFSKSYKNSIKGFANLEGQQKVLTVVASIFCGLAFVVGGFAAFRGIVSWLHPGEDATADKVNLMVKRRSSSLTSPLILSPHPAEQPTDRDLLSTQPRDPLKIIISYLDEKSLRCIATTSKTLLEVSDFAWKQYVEQRVGAAVATQLKSSRASWRAVMIDLNRPFTLLSKQLRVLGAPTSNLGDKTELNAVLESIKDHNTEDLKAALISMQEADKCHELNLRYFEYTSLELAAAHGNIEQAALLIEYGAADAIRRQIYTYKEDWVQEHSALFYAAYKGHVAMVRFLLEKGANPALNLEKHGYNQPLLTVLISSIREEDTSILECLLLLIKAWKAEIGHTAVCKHENAVTALGMAIDKGFVRIAHLLFGLGVRFVPSQNYVYTLVNDKIIQKNLEILKFLHIRQIVDLKSIRTPSGATLLHTAVALQAHDILKYLTDEVKVPTDVRNKDNETYDVSGQKELEQNICRALIYGLDFGSFYDEQSGLKLKSLEECLKHHIDLNVSINNEGQTLLHIAVKWILYSVRNIDLLLAHGANPKIPDNKGITPLQLAKDALNAEKNEQRTFDKKDDILRAKNLIKKMENLFC